MPDSQVKVTITTDDKTDRGTQSAKDNFKGLGKGINDTVAELTGFNVASLGVAAAVGMVANEVRKTIDEYSGYVESIDKMSMATGMQAEETSRLIQVADDFRVSQQAVEQAMRMALQNGFTPSIDALAKMSDKYLSIKDPAERAAEMQKVFGRAWQEMVPFLEKGGDAIRAAAAGIGDGLVVTDAAIQANREYVASVDTLNDSWTEFKYNITRDVIPAINELLSAVNTRDKLAALGFRGNELERMVRAMEDGKQANKEWSSSDREAAKAAQYYNSAIDDSTDKTKDYTAAMNRAQKEESESVKLWGKATDRMKERSDLYGELIGATKAAKSAQEDFNQSFGDKAQSAMEKYTSRGKKYEEWLGAIDKATGSNRLEQKKANDELDKLALGFFTGKVKAEDLGKALGEQKDAFSKFDEDLVNSKLRVEELTTKWNQFITGIAGADGMHVEITADVVTSGGGGKSGSSGGGRGTPDMATPKAGGGPVSAGSPYTVGENGWELFVPQQSGYIYDHETSKGIVAGGTTVNIYNPSVRSESDIARMAAQIKGVTGRRARDK